MIMSECFNDYALETILQLCSTLLNHPAKTNRAHIQLLARFCGHECGREHYDAIDASERTMYGRLRQIYENCGANTFANECAQRCLR